MELTKMTSGCNVVQASLSMSMKTSTTIGFFKPFLLFFLFCFPCFSYASSGTEGAAFLDIPVGAGPASLGAAYSALADDAYAPVINPAGLGFIESSQLAAQYLPYLESINYEQFSFGVPLPRNRSCSDPNSCPGSALGGSIQYLGAGN